MKTDVVIIGAGVVGCAVARELTRFNVNVTVLEAGSDVAEGASKANSAIVHAGFDAKPGTNKAKFNVLGNRMFEDVCRELKVPFRRNGSLVLAFGAEDERTLAELKARGEQNGVPTEIVDPAELRRRETTSRPTRARRRQSSSRRLTKWKTNRRHDDDNDRRGVDADYRHKGVRNRAGGDRGLREDVPRTLSRREEGNRGR